MHKHCVLNPKQQAVVSTKTKICFSLCVCVVHRSHNRTPLQQVPIAIASAPSRLSQISQNNFHLLIDCSGSMAGNRITQAREIAALCEKLRINHSISTFDTKLTHNTNSVDLKGSGRTAIGDCLLQFVEDIVAANAIQFRYRNVLLLTDCEDDLPEGFVSTFNAILPPGMIFGLVHINNDENSDNTKTTRQGLETVFGKKCFFVTDVTWRDVKQQLIDFIGQKRKELHNLDAVVQQRFPELTDAANEIMKAVEQVQRHQEINNQAEAFYTQSVKQLSSSEFASAQERTEYLTLLSSELQSVVDTLKTWIREAPTITPQELLATLTLELDHMHDLTTQVEKRLSAKGLRRTIVAVAEDIQPMELAQRLGIMEQIEQTFANANTLKESVHLYLRRNVESVTLLEQRAIRAKTDQLIGTMQLLKEKVDDMLN
eukprot:c7363_g1_i2.p1 GENE.c7363_g1_i2~~c7363_g1_i2.p1  ORF type:complete len:429 (-),score=93.86 c7363_g1_i2:159-1445(-)